MRILMVSQWFDPEPADVKGLPFARELARRGHEVVVITGFPNYPGGKIYPGYRIQCWQRERRNGIDVIRVPLYPSHSLSKWGRIVNYSSFALAASTIGLFVAGRADVAYIYHPPATVALPALLSRLLWGTPCIIDIQDLWPDAIEATGIIRNRAILKAIGLFSNVVNRLVSRIVVLSPGFRQRLLERGIPAKKVEVIYNWSRMDGAPPCTARLPDNEAAVLKDKFNVLFAGNLGPAQALSNVVAAAGMICESHPEVQFVFVGSGIDEEALRAAASGLPNVLFLPRRHPSEMAPLFEMASALLVHLRDEPHFAITIPSKTQDYLAAGKPLIMAVRGDAAQMVLDSAGGVVCEPEQPSQLVAAIERLLSLSEVERTAMGRAGRNYYTLNLSLGAGVDRFVALFLELQGARRERQEAEELPRAKE